MGKQGQQIKFLTSSNPILSGCFGGTETYWEGSMGGRSTVREEKSQPSLWCMRLIDIMYLHMSSSLGLKPRELGCAVRAAVGAAESIHTAQQKGAPMCQTDLMIKTRFCSILSPLKMQFCNWSGEVEGFCERSWPSHDLHLYVEKLWKSENLHIKTVWEQIRMQILPDAQGEELGHWQESSTIINWGAPSQQGTATYS